MVFLCGFSIFSDAIYLTIVPHPEELGYEENDGQYIGLIEDETTEVLNTTEI